MGCAWQFDNRTTWHNAGADHGRFRHRGIQGVVRQYARERIETGSAN